MILLLDTSTAVCRLSFVDGSWRSDNHWQADRGLAKGLLKYINDKLLENSKSWSSITGIGVFTGPGSYTGLRIGLAVANTMSDAQNIPIVGARGGNWQNDVLEKLNSGKNEKVILPFYGGEAHITIPKK